MPTPSPHARRSRTGFTLIELLVTLSIIIVLLGLLLPALATARASAERVRLASNLRQLLVGYTAYQGEHRGDVLYGYTPPTVLGEPVTVKAESGHRFGLPVADRYPWRLAPYVSNVWEVLHSHQPVPPLPRPEDNDTEAMLKAYTLSLSPTFGINSIYVGGHGDGPFAGFITRHGHTVPNRGAHVVFNNGEVRQPSDLIAFAETQARQGPFSEPDAGLHFVTPPRANGRRWRAAGAGFDLLMPGHITGLPQGRHTDAAPIGFFDGHVAALRSAQLDDMRLWANGARDSHHDPIP